MQDRISPTTVRFIKLGSGGMFEKSCIETEQVLRLGYESHQHEESLAGNWDAVYATWLQERGGNRRTASADLRQIKEFYTLPETCLWITFYKRKLYWCFAHQEVTEHASGDGTRVREAIGGWSDSDMNGKPLSVESLDGRLTRVQGFRGTICGIEESLKDYLERRINGIDQPDVARARIALAELRTSSEDLIRGLWWKDFELLTDLIFSQSGWQRVSVLGKTDKDIDLHVQSPVTGSQAFVQVKSEAPRAVLDESVRNFDEQVQFDEMYFVVHTPRFDVDLAMEEINEERARPVRVLGLQQISDLVINAGLINWLITKRS